MRENDFQKVLLDHIKTLNFSLQPRLDYFEDDKDDLVINQIPGGKVDREYMDGTQEISLPFEIAVKARKNTLANETIWAVTNELSRFDLKLPSSDGSYEYLGMDVSRPASKGKDNRGFYYYTIEIVAKIVIERNEEQ
jgi:hypothetical protein